jgi:hypothetical protein
MARLKLLDLKCFETEDVGADEAYITVRGNKIWSTDGIKSGEQVSLRHVNPIKFKGEAEVALWDEDTGMFDSNDQIGKFTVYEDTADQDEQHYEIKGDGAHYLLIFKVLEG